MSEFQISDNNVTVVPFRCELGITGAMVIGKGEYKFVPKDGDEIKGEFRATMLRFNPKDQPKLLSLEGLQPSMVYTVLAMSNH